MHLQGVGVTLVRNPPGRPGDRDFGHRMQGVQHRHGETVLSGTAAARRAARPVVGSRAASRAARIAHPRSATSRGTSSSRRGFGAAGVRVERGPHREQVDAGGEGVLLDPSHPPLVGHERLGEAAGLAHRGGHPVRGPVGHRQQTQQGAGPAKPAACWRSNSRARHNPGTVSRATTITNGDSPANRPGHRPRQSAAGASTRASVDTPAPPWAPNSHTAGAGASDSACGTG